MAIFTDPSQWVFIFGIIGNIIAFITFLSPIPTFHKIVKKKSTQEFQPTPYLVTLFSSLLWIYYALTKTNSMLLITINSIGVVIESLYIVLFIIYASRSIRILTMKILFLLDIGLFSTIYLLTHFLLKGAERLQIIGLVCLVCNILVFMSPLGVLRTVVRTKNVDSMPLPLSLALTMNAITWFFYGLLQKDYYITVPNVLGIGFGIIQIGVYLWYSGYKNVPEDPTLPIAMATMKENNSTDEHDHKEKKVSVQAMISRASTN